MHKENSNTIATEVKFPEPCSRMSLYQLHRTIKVSARYAKPREQDRRARQNWNQPSVDSLMGLGRDDFTTFEAKPRTKD
jgi:hypothetical protein